LQEGENVINLMMELSSIGIYQPLESHILDFLKALPIVAKQQGVQFATPSMVIAKNKPVGPMEMVHPVSWNDEERDTSSVLGNGMQREAFAKLYDEKVVGRILACKDRRIKQDWDRLQATDNFRFMTTKHSDFGVYRGLYDSEYDAFTNYMNILGDFLKRVKDMFSDAVENDELNSLYTQITNMGKELNVKENEISRLRARLEKYEGGEAPEPEKKTVSKTDAKAEAKPAKKPRAKKADTKETPVKETPVTEAPAKKPKAKKAEKKEAPVKEAAVKEVAVKEAPAKKDTVKKETKKQTPTKKQTEKKTK
ncbi:MAG: hypothetical protein HUK03_04875, partial [Bacteroidaceae bacterium]|nr:hypothetical protein [Bacteroidaceae bacterium]